MSRARCDACVFYRRHPSLGAGEGACVAALPAIGRKGRGTWPIVPAHAVCGHFSRVTFELADGELPNEFQETSESEDP